MKIYAAALAKLSLISSAILYGCTLTPQPMLGAALKPGQVAPGLAWGVNYQPSATKLANGAQAQQVSGNSGSAIGGSAVNVSNAVPAALVVQASVLPSVDVGVHAGWYGAGMAGRYRFTGPDSPITTSATLDGQLGYALPHDTRTTTLPTPYAVRLLNETSFRLHANAQLLTALGVSFGNRRHGVDVSPNAPDRVDGLFGPNVLVAQRKEVRLETGVGAYVGFGRRFGIQAMIAPYVVLEHHDTEFECLNCTAPVSPTSFRQTWGFAILLNPFVMLDVGEH